MTLSRLEPPPIHIGTNAVVSWLSLAIRIASSLLIFRILLGTLGPSVFGLWLVAGDLTGHASLLNFGLSAALVREIARLEGLHKISRSGLLVRSLLSLFVCIGVVVGILLIVGARSIVGLFELPVEVLSECVLAFQIAVLRLCLAFPAAVLAAALRGGRRHDIEYAIQGASYLVRLPAIAVLVHTPQDIVTLAWLSLFVDVGESLLRLLAVRRLSPWFSFRPGRVSWKLLRSVHVFGRDSLVLSVSHRVQYHLDSLVVGLVLGLSLVPVYEAAARLVGMAREFIDRTADVVAPSVAAQSRTKTIGGLRLLLLAWTRTLVSLTGLVFLGMVLIGPAFLAAFFESELSEQQLQQSAWILWLLATAVLSRSVAAIPGAFLWGIGKIRRPMQLSIAEMSANLFLSLALVWPLGLPGVALGTLIPRVVSDLYFLPRWAAEEARIEHALILQPLHRFAREATLPVVGTIGALWALGAGWGSIVLASLVCTSLYSVPLLRSFRWLGGRGADEVLAPDSGPSRER